MEARAPPVTKIQTLNARTFLPRDSVATSSSRIARKTRPKGEWTIRQQIKKHRTAKPNTRGIKAAGVAIEKPAKEGRGIPLIPDATRARPIQFIRMV